MCSDFDPISDIIKIKKICIEFWLKTYIFCSLRLKFSAIPPCPALSLSLWWERMKSYFVSFYVSHLHTLHWFYCTKNQIKIKDNLNLTLLTKFDTLNFFYFVPKNNTKRLFLAKIFCIALEENVYTCETTSANRKE